MKYGIFFLGVILLTSAVYAGELDNASFKQTINGLKHAAIMGDSKLLTEHIALSGIVRAKLKKYAGKALQKKSLITRATGRLADFSEPMITKASTSFILNRFSNSSPGLRQRYVNSLKLTQISEQPENAFAAGSFLGQPIIISAIKSDNKWIIVGAESPLLDQEFKKMLRILHIPIS